MVGNMAITIVDIAKKANTTHGTVSRALRDSSKVNIKTRERIQMIAQKMGYRPHYAGKILKSGKTHTIGVIIPDLTNPFYVELMRAMQDECLGREYEAFCMDYAMDHQRERACLEQMLSRRCDGIITMPSKFDILGDLLNEFWDAKLPCVALGLPADIGDIKIDGIDVDIESGINAAVGHLVSLGHERIVFAGSWPEESFNAERRFGGFEKAVKEHGLGFSSERNTLYHFSGNQVVDGRVLAETILEKIPETTGIIATNDYLAIGMMQLLNQKGIRVPDDVSIVGTDNTWIGRSWTVPLTSISQRAGGQAKAAVEMILARLEKDEWDDPKHMEWFTSLEVRESTGPAKRTEG